MRILFLLVLAVCSGCGYTLAGQFIATPENKELKQDTQGSVEA